MLKFCADGAGRRAIVADPTRMTVAADGVVSIWLLWVYGETQYDSSTNRPWVYEWSRWVLDCNGRWGLLEGHYYSEDGNVIGGYSAPADATWESVVPQTII